MALRLAVLFHRNRMDLVIPNLKLSLSGGEFELKLPADWLAQNPLTETELEAEIGFWKDAGVSFKIQHNI